MPLTPLHYPVAFILYHIFKKQLSLPVLIISSMISDLEIPFIFFLTGGLVDRLILHSLIGGLIFGIPLTIIVFLPLYKLFFKKMIFTVSFNDKSYKILFLSATIGILSHILLDSIQHPYNPLFWPISYNSFNYLILFNDLILASNLLYILFTAAMLVILLYVLLNRRGFLTQIFIG